MIVLVRGNAVDNEGDQRALLEHVTSNGNLCVHLLGNDEEYIICPNDLSGIELNSELKVFFKVTEIIRSKRS